MSKNQNSKVRKAHATRLARQVGMDSSEADLFSQVMERYYKLKIPAEVAIQMSMMALAHQSHCQVFYSKKPSWMS